MALGNGLRSLARLLLAALVLVAPRPASAFDLDDVLAYLEFDAVQKAELLAGKIVAKRVAESPEATELAITVAALFPSTLEGVYGFVQRGEALKADRNIRAFQEIVSEPPEPDFAGVGFTAEQASEVTDLLAFDGGSAFNLSAREIAELRNLRARYRDGTKPEAREAASAAYRGFLAARYRAYREGGLGGIAGYDRGQGRTVDPSEKLRLAASASRFFQKHEPAVYQAFAHFPQKKGDAAHRFYWINQEVQGRPTFLLSHRVLVRRPGFVAQAERQFFIGHSYNSVQIMTAALPVEQGIVVFYGNRTSIDQLAGFTGKVARPIASSRLIERVTERFEMLRGAIPGAE